VKNLNQGGLLLSLLKSMRIAEVKSKALSEAGMQVPVKIPAGFTFFSRWAS